MSKTKYHIILPLLIILHGITGCLLPPVSKTSTVQPEPVIEKTETTEPLKKTKPASALELTGVQTLHEAGVFIAKDVASFLPEGKSSVAILPPKITGGKGNPSFERRIAEIITGQVKPLLPQGYRLSERFNLEKIVKEGTLYGEEYIDDLVKKAGVDITITGSYSVLREAETIELNYRAINISNIEVLSTSRTVHIPLSEISRKRGGILALVNPEGILSTEGGREAAMRVEVLIKKLLSRNKLSVIEAEYNPLSDDFIKIAEKSGADFLILLEVSGKKRYTDFGNIKASASVAVKIYRMPEGDTIAVKRKTKEILSVSADEDPLSDAIGWIMDKLGTEIIKTVKEK